MGGGWWMMRLVVKKKLDVDVVGWFFGCGSSGSGLAWDDLVSNWSKVI